MTKSQAATYARLSRTLVIDLGDTWPFPAASESRHAGRNEWFKISELRADELLNVLPPIYFKGGFFVSEPATHDERGMPVYSAVCAVNGSHYLREVVADGIGQARAELLAALAEPPK